MKKIILMVCLILQSVTVCYGYTTPQICDAIFKAENSRSKPYGIMKPYCTPETVDKCRLGCIQTVDHARRDFKGGTETEFLQFLQSRYAPSNDKTDRHNLNANWLRLVTYFLQYN